MPEKTLSEITYAEYRCALDIMTHAHEYIALQFATTMTRAEAVAHFQARALLINLRSEAETLLLGEAGPPVRVTMREGQQ